MPKIWMAVNCGFDPNPKVKRGDIVAEPDVTREQLDWCCEGQSGRHIEGLCHKKACFIKGYEGYNYALSRVIQEEDMSECSNLWRLIGTTALTQSDQLPPQLAQDASHNAIPSSAECIIDSLNNQYMTFSSQSVGWPFKKSKLPVVAKPKINPSYSEPMGLP